MTSGDRQCACGCGRSMAGFHPRQKYQGGHRPPQVPRRPTASEMEMDPILRLDPCAYCGAPRETWKPEVGVDHIVPVSRGGSRTWDNLTGACMQCNSSKGTRSLLEYLASNYLAARRQEVA